MGLFVRMCLYFLAAAAAGAGIVDFDPEAATVTANLDDLAVIVGGTVSFVGTFIVGRIGAARKGWRT